MKTIRHTLLSLVALLGLTACTHNDGDIGPWFGTWHVEQVTASTNDYDGTSDNNLFLQFQSTVISMRATLDNHVVLSSFGHWEVDGDKLTVTFPDASQRIQMAAWMDCDATNRFTVRTITGSNMVLETSVDGVTYVITLKKWG